MFTLKIRTDNAAFSDGNREAEIARILRHAADLVEQGVNHRRLLDLNGNIVGEFDCDNEETD